MTVLRRDIGRPVELKALPFPSFPLLPAPPLELFSKGRSAGFTVGEAKGFGSVVAAEIGSFAESFADKFIELTASGDPGTTSFKGFSACS